MSARELPVGMRELTPGFDEMLELLGLEETEESLHVPCYSTVSLVAFVTDFTGAWKGYVVGRGTRTYADRITTAFHVARSARSAIADGAQLYMYAGRVDVARARDLVLPKHGRIERVQLFELSSERDVCEMRVERVIFDRLATRVAGKSAWCERDIAALAYTELGNPVHRVVLPHTWTSQTLVIPPAYGLGRGDSGLGVFNGRGAHIGIVIGEADEAPSPGWVVIQLNVRVDQRILRLFSRRRVFRRQRGVALSPGQAEEYERFKDEVVAEMGEAVWREADAFSIGYLGGKFYLEATADRGRVGITTVDEDFAVHFLGGRAQAQDLIDDADGDERDWDDESSRSGDREDDTDPGVVEDDDFVVAPPGEDADAELYAWQTKTGGLAEQLASADREYHQRVKTRWSGEPDFEGEQLRDLMDMYPGLVVANPAPDLNPPGMFDVAPVAEPPASEGLAPKVKAPVVYDVRPVQPELPGEVEDFARAAAMGSKGAPLPEIKQRKPKNSKAPAAAGTLAPVSLNTRDFLRGVFPFEEALSEDDKSLLDETRRTLAQMAPVVESFGELSEMKANMTAEKYEDAVAFLDSYNNAWSILKRLERRQRDSGPNRGNTNWEAYNSYREKVKAALANSPTLAQHLGTQYMTSEYRSEKQLSLPSVYVILAKRMLTTLNEAKARTDYAAAQLKKEKTAGGVTTAQTHLDRMKELKAKLEKKQ